MTQPATRPVAGRERALERILKGAANHRRLQMLELLDACPELALEEVCARLRINGRTGSEHLRRLTIAGLVIKRNEGRFVRHRLAPRGQRMLAFVRTLE
jgi:DNA-binding transcriptional ArsR family regulator